MAKATIDDVAHLAGVSIKTVSRVVNREPNVRESTRAKVEEAIAKLNYRPNQSARNLASQHARLIVLVYDDPSEYELPSGGYIIKLQEGVLRACRAANYELLIHPCAGSSRHIDDELASLIEQVRPAGMIVAAPLSNMPRVVRAIAQSGTPMVRLSPGDEKKDEYAVSTNDREICAAMTRHLVSLGHERIAFIKGNTRHKAVGMRYEGFLDGLRESGAMHDEDLVVQGDNSFGSGEELANELLSMTSPPTAIFAANDDMAVGVIRSADRMGIRVPDELSVAGFDDTALAQQVYPTLTTINQPLAEMAEQAALALIRSAGDGVELRGSKVVPAALEIRESTGPAADGK